MTPFFGCRRIFIRMQQRVIVNKGKRFLVNVATEDGVGAGFATGQLVVKSIDDLNWYVVTTSGNAGSVVIEVSQSALPFTQSGSAYRQYDNSVQSSSAVTFFEQNFPYQLVAGSDAKTYKVYADGSAPTATLEVSQSAFWNYSYITNSFGAVIDVSKPHLLLQNITDGNYYRVYVLNTAGTITLEVDQTVVSGSWVHPIY